MDKRILAFAIAAVFSAGAYAQGGGGQGGGQAPGGGSVTPQELDFHELDIDGDGYISKNEAQVLQQLSQQMDQYDVDKDQRLDQGEFSAFEEQALGAGGGGGGQGGGGGGQGGGGGMPGGDGM